MILFLSIQRAIGSDTCCTVNETRAMYGELAGMADDEAFITTVGIFACVAIAARARGSGVAGLTRAVMVSVGEQGQGSEGIFAQIAADAVGVAMSKVRIRVGAEVEAGEDVDLVAHDEFLRQALGHVGG